MIDPTIRQTNERINIIEKMLNSCFRTGASIVVEVSNVGAGSVGAVALAMTLGAG